MKCNLQQLSNIVNVIRLKIEIKKVLQNWELNITNKLIVYAFVSLSRRYKLLLS